MPQPDHPLAPRGHRGHGGCRIVAGTDDAVMMVESEAKELSEDVMLGAVMAGWKAFQPVISGIIELAEMCAKDAWDVPQTPDHIKKLEADIKSKYAGDVAKAYGIMNKLERQTAVGEVKKAAVEAFVNEEAGITEQIVTGKFKSRYIATMPGL